MTTTPPQATQDAVCESCRETCAQAVQTDEFYRDECGEKAAALIRALPTRAQDEGEPVSETYRLDEGERDFALRLADRIRGDEVHNVPFLAGAQPHEYRAVSNAKAAEIILAELAAAGYSWRTAQPAQDDGERDELAAIVSECQKTGHGPLIIADAIQGVGYSRRVTPDTDAVKWIRVVSEELVNAGFPPGDRDVALSSIRALIKGRTEATGEAQSAYVQRVAQYVPYVLHDNDGWDSLAHPADRAKLIDAIVKAMNEYGDIRARAAEERAIERCAKLREVAELAASANNELQRMYDGQDNERKTRGAVGSIHRDIFEAYLDNLVEEAEGALNG